MFVEVFRGYQLQFQGSSFRFLALLANIELHKIIPSHQRPVIIKPVSLIFEISPIRGKCRRSLSPQKTRV